MEEQMQIEIINFMFIRDSNGNLNIMNCLQLWFGKSNDTDIKIRDRFGTHTANALCGKLDHWRNTPQGCLALMILIDQFPRNIYRHTIRMFAGDQMSRRMVYSSSHNWMKELRPEECLFVPCMIMVHQENLADQEFGWRFYNELEPLLPPSCHIFRSIFEEHHRIIKSCGTFPHRDHYYSRNTSAIGQSLLDNPTVRFDLPLCMKDDGQLYFGHDPTKLWAATQRTFDVIDRIDALINSSARLRSPTSPHSTIITHSTELQEMFRTFDKDGSGFLEVDELATVLVSTGHHYSNFQLQEAVDHVTGRQGSAGLTFEQFTNLLRINLVQTSEARLQRRFDFFDADHSGEISLDEFTACVQVLDSLVTSSEAAAMFKQCDQNGDGSISMQEFADKMKRRPSVESYA